MTDLQIPARKYCDHESYRIQQGLQLVSLNQQIGIRNDANSIQWYQSESAHIISVTLVSSLQQLNVF